MTPRTYVAALILLVGICATHILRPNVASAGLQKPLREFPAVTGFSQSEDRPFDDEIVRAIGADDYLNRAYVGPTPTVELYIAYYKDQRSSDAIHSPRNCLPGAGWEPVHSSRVDIGSASSGPIIVNAYLVANGPRRDMVLYWYQANGRVVASEYWAKFWLMADTLKHKGTGGSMIRIWTTAADGETPAQARAIDFARRVYPQIAELLPG